MTVAVREWDGMRGGGVWGVLWGYCGAEGAAFGGFQVIGGPAVRRGRVLCIWEPGH